MSRRERLQQGSDGYVRLRSGHHTVLLAPIAAAGSIRQLPVVLRVVLENLVRQRLLGEDVSNQIDALLARLTGARLSPRPSRALLHETTDLPVLVDLASLRDAVAAAGGDPGEVNPALPVDMLSEAPLAPPFPATVQTRRTGIHLKKSRRDERREFLDWCRRSFRQLRPLPSGSEGPQQYNLERLTGIIHTERRSGGILAYPEMVVGSDPHTTAASGLGIFGWGLDGLELQAVLLGKPLSFALPPVVGIELVGRLRAEAGAVDLALTIGGTLRDFGVEGKLVEFFGPGVQALSCSERAAIAGTAPQCGAICLYFPIDARTLDYLRRMGEPETQVRLVENYSKLQHLCLEPTTPLPEYDAILKVDLDSVRRSIVSLAQPRKRFDLEAAARAFTVDRERIAAGKSFRNSVRHTDPHALGDGAVVVAAITHSIDGSNPLDLLVAGLLARNAAAKGLTIKPWVHAAFTAPGRRLAKILRRTGLRESFCALGFHETTPVEDDSSCAHVQLLESIRAAIDLGIVPVAVLSGCALSPDVLYPDASAAYGASPAIVVAYALAGSISVELLGEPLGRCADGSPAFLEDVWPTPDEIGAVLATARELHLPRKGFGTTHRLEGEWSPVAGEFRSRFPWPGSGTLLSRAPVFDALTLSPPGMADIVGMRPLALLGDNVTAEEISPSGAIIAGSPAAEFLLQNGVASSDFGSYRMRRGSPEVAIRATFANPRLRNRLAGGKAGGLTRLMPEGTNMRLFDAACEYQRRGVPLAVIAGNRYGCGSPHDWTAKGVALLGVKAVIAESFDRLQRKSLIGAGVLPLLFPEGTSAATLALCGSETFDLVKLDWSVGVRTNVTCIIRRSGTSWTRTILRAAIETADELLHLRHGGILPALWRERLGADSR
ncbi:MAG: aconitate hydratase AcnA [Gammaproteobacteria bacterium]|nr:aconitate hydratase AcnA [Gammaproteobacteria bacterium]